MPRNTGALTALQAALMGVSGGLAGYTKDEEMRAEQRERARLLAEREAERKALADERQQMAAERERDRLAAAQRFDADQARWAFSQGLESRSALDRAINAPNIIDTANAMPQPEGWMGKPLTFEKDWFAPMAKKAEETLSRGRQVDLPVSSGMAAYYQPFARTPEAEIERTAAKELADRQAREAQDRREADLRLKIAGIQNAPTPVNPEAEVRKQLLDAVSSGVVEEVPIDPQNPTIGGTRRVRRNLTSDERLALEFQLRRAAGLPVEDSMARRFDPGYAQWLRDKNLLPSSTGR